MELRPYSHEEHFELWSETVRGASFLDRYCSSGFWGEPQGVAFLQSNQLLCYRSEHGLAFFSQREVPGGQILGPPDGMWLLGTPILGPTPHRMLRDLLSYWGKAPGMRQVVLSGLYPENPLCSPDLWRSLGGWEIETSGRVVASLEGGMDGFMSRRSKNFRSRLRRTLKAARAAGAEPDWMPRAADRSQCEELLQRILKIESQSWKGRAGRGIDEGAMHLFYQAMIPLLAAHGLLRGLFLRHEDRDLAYLFGASFDGYFRGLQFSYVHQEDTGLGNVCQYLMIERLVEEGCRDYDLGQAMEYKNRWAEKHIVSRTFVFQF